MGLVVDQLTNVELTSPAKAAPHRALKRTITRLDLTTHMHPRICVYVGSGIIDDLFEGFFTGTFGEYPREMNILNSSFDSVIWSDRSTRFAAEQAHSHKHPCNQTSVLSLWP